MKTMKLVVVAVFFIVLFLSVFYVMASGLLQRFVSGLHERNEENKWKNADYNNTWSEEDYGPTIGKSDADTGGYDLLPFNICPDSIVPQWGEQKTILTAMLNGKEYAVQGEDWIKANCNPGLWVFEKPRNMTKEDYMKLLPSCGSNKELFSVIPVDMNKAIAIVPLGNFNPAGGHVYPTDHLYFSSGTTFESTLYAPGNGWIVEIRYWDRGTYIDYTVDFAPCKEVLVRWDHVRSLSQKLNDAFVEPYDETGDYVTGGTTRKVKDKLMNVSVSAGEVLGVAGAGDWATFDSRANNIFANPSRYQPYEYANATCPIDYYTPSVKATLTAKLGNSDGSVKRTILPLCGELAQDVPNTAQGIWVIPGKGPFEDVNQEKYQLTLAHDNVDPSQGVFAVGPSINDIPTSIYTFTPTSSGLVNHDFKDVKSDGNVYCYDVTTKDFGNTVTSIILQLTSPTTLRIARYYSSCGSGPWTFSQYTDFER